MFSRTENLWQRIENDRYVTRGFLVQILQRYYPLQVIRPSVTMSTLEARQEC